MIWIIPPMALLGTVFLALLILGLAACIVGLATCIVGLGLPIGIISSLLAIANETSTAEDVAQQRCLNFISRHNRLQ